MSIADKLSYLAGTKEEIRQAIIGKGVAVLETDAFRAYAGKIENIISGGGSEPAEESWPDITSIVENDADNTYPYKCIWLLRNNSPTFDYTFGTGVSKVLLSDGVTYTDSFVEHAWGANTDTSIVNYRWVILYMSSNSNFQIDARPISITYNSTFLNEKTSFSSMFSGCYSLQTIPLLDTSSGTDFSSMFSGCHSLQTIPELDTSKGTNFSSMFYNCSSLQYIRVGNDPKSHQYNSSVSLNASQYLAKESVINIFNHLPPTGGQEQTIALHPQVGNKLSEEDISIATNKGWTVTF